MKSKSIVKIILIYCSILVISIILSLISKQPSQLVSVCIVSDGAFDNLSNCFGFKDLVLDILFWYLIVFALYTTIRFIKKKK